ncbi:M24 family metallopeptidase [Membranihabitans marinus]|uniref:M24 family metallopeptidase n=1 Tax=Membranihabitans marinus TaxID=1227546 RepID=UPI001F1CEE73|nr:M24 family metallopeptidase [Membranihabitans marinus]
MPANIKSQLIIAEQKALELFQEMENLHLITPGKMEKELNNEIFDLAFKMFGIKKYWHKRIIRAGKNTLYPYRENPADLMIQEDDILFVDFGPIFDEWEADFGRTYVLGSDPIKHKLKEDIEIGWQRCKSYFDQQSFITGRDLFQYAVETAEDMGWEFGGEIAGHIIGHFPHEKLENENKTHYVHPDNTVDMFAPDSNGEPREWILEIHFVNRELEIGGFFEQLMT